MIILINELDELQILNDFWIKYFNFYYVLEPHGTRCCSSTGQLLELANIPEHCYPIVLPENDPMATQANIRCMNFVRTITDRDRNCVGGNQPAEQVSKYVLEKHLLIKNLHYVYF